VPNFLSTHPEPLARVQEIQPQLAELRAGQANLRTDREALLRRMDGLLFGDNPEQGIFRGTEFLHPVLRFRLTFPEGWDVQNSPQQVMAKAPDAEVYMLLQAVPMEAARGGNIQDIAINSMESAGFRAVQGERTTINGIQSFVGVYQGQLEGGGTVAMRAAHIPHNGTVYLLGGLTSPDIFQQADGAFVSAIRTFRPLSAAEAEGIRPNRIDLYVVRQGDTWASLAEGNGNLITPSSLAIMNNAQPNSTPEVGSRIKLVVGG
jgi:predicted Zn-dependent protease